MSQPIAYQFRDVLDMMRAGANVRLQSLHADGGPTRNEFLMRHQLRTGLLITQTGLPSLLA